MCGTKILIAVASQYSRSKAFESFLTDVGYDVRIVTRDIGNKFNFLNFFREIVSWKPRIVHIINDPEAIVVPTTIASKLVGAKIIYDKRANCSIERKELRRDIYYFLELFAETLFPRYYDAKITPLYRVHKEKKYILIPQAIKAIFPPRAARKNKKHIIMTGCTFSEMRGLDTLVDSMGHVQHNDVELWVFGDGIMHKQIETASDKDSRIKIFGRIPHEQFIEKIIEADVCIIPFNKTAASEYVSPYSVLKLGEFTFFEKPIICADVGDMRLAEGNGLVFYSPGDPKDLARKIDLQIDAPRKTTFFKELEYAHVKNMYLKLIRGLCSTH